MFLIEALTSDDSSLWLSWHKTSQYTLIHIFIQYFRSILFFLHPYTCIYTAMHVHMCTRTCRNIGMHVCTSILLVDMTCVWTYLCAYIWCYISGSTHPSRTGLDGPISHLLLPSPYFASHCELSNLVQVLAPQRHLLTTLFLKIDI